MMNITDIIKKNISISNSRIAASFLMSNDEAVNAATSTIDYEAYIKQHLSRMLAEEVSKRTPIIQSDSPFSHRYTMEGLYFPNTFEFEQFLLTMCREIIEEIGRQANGEVD